MMPPDITKLIVRTSMKDRTCHVIAADATASAVKKMVKDDRGAHNVKPVDGCMLTLRDKNGHVTVTDENGDTAHVTIADVKQSNGVIHVIDKVLLPKS